MSKLTRHGIAHDLNISPYEYTVSYGNDNELTFIFSSELYKTKFDEKLDSYRAKVSHSLSKRFGFKIINNMLADIKLYSITETRGFLIKGKEDYSCQNTIELIGENLTQTS